MIPSLELTGSCYLGPTDSVDSTEVAIAETNGVPFKLVSISVTDWSSSFRSWPTAITGWRNWCLRVEAAKSAIWVDLDITHCIGLTLQNPDKFEPLLAAATYFWLDAFNCFLFGPMSPTLLDVFLITCLDVRDSADPISLQKDTTYRIDVRKKAGGWVNYIKASFVSRRFCQE